MPALKAWHEQMHDNLGGISEPASWFHTSLSNLLVKLEYSVILEDGRGQRVFTVLFSDLEGFR